MISIQKIMDKLDGLSEQEKRDAADIAAVFRELSPRNQGIILGYAAALSVEPKQEEKKGA